MKKYSINMLSSADDVPGQGVGSAYIEQVNLVKNNANGKYDVYVNDKKIHEVQHFHTINYGHYIKMKKNKSINVSYVHFLPHTLDGSINLPKLIFDAFKKYVIKFYKSADALVVVNPIFIEELAQYDIPKESIYYIPNFVSKESFYKLEDEEKTEVKKRYQLCNSSKVILGVGQVQTRKGVLDFVEVARGMPEYTFVWSGGFSFGAITDGYKELKEVVDNPPENVKFIGIIPREEMNTIYNLADVLFMPSYNELFPMSILEAVSSEVPLVLRDLELYEDILFKKYLKGKSNSEFIKLIRLVLEDKECNEECRHHSKYISDFYSEKNVYNQWEDFYQEMFDKYDAKFKNKSKKKL